MPRAEPNAKDARKLETWCLVAGFAVPLLALVTLWAMLELRVVTLLFILVIPLLGVVDLIRTYFHLSAPRIQLTAHALGIPALFKGLINARDVAVGRPVGANGRTVRAGLLYRSAKVYGLQAADMEQLQQMGIKLIVDLRSQGEIDAEPNSFAGGQILNYKHMPISAVDYRGLVKNRISQGMPSGWAKEFCMNGAAEFVTHHSKAFRKFLEEVSEAENLPCLVHCTMGKDRTGWAVALLLFALGVSEEAVIDEYLLSNALTHPLSRKYMVLIRLFSGFRITAENCAPFLLVNPEYMESSINAAKASHGTIERYMTAPDGLGLDPKTLQKLRDHFLE